MNVSSASHYGFHSSAQISRARPAEATIASRAAAVEIQPTAQSTIEPGDPRAGAQTPTVSNASTPTHDHDQRAVALKEQQLQQQQILQLASRDREVRAHEQAHVAAGGPYAGAATYQYERGPNGVNYAVAGQVSISTGAEATPQATLEKAQIIRRAALAPADPSPQDRQVAATATQLEVQARREIATAVQQDEDSEQIADTARSGSGGSGANLTAGESADDHAQAALPPDNAIAPSVDNRILSQRLALRLSSAEQFFERRSGDRVSQFA